MRSEVTNRRGVFLSTELAGRREIRLALAAVLISSLIFLAIAPLAKVPLGKIPAFNPIYASAQVICDVITAVLLYNQFRVRAHPRPQPLFAPLPWCSRRARVHAVRGDRD